MAQPDLTRDEARNLTDRVKQTSERLYAVLTLLHDRRADRALGYGSWAEYVAVEFGITPRRSYQLLQQGRVLAEIGGEMGTAVHMPERVIREIKDDAPAVVEAAKALVEAGEAPGKAIETAVEEVKDRRRADRKAERDRKSAEEAVTQARHERIRAEGDARLAAQKAEKQAARGTYEAAKPEHQRQAEQQAQATRRAAAQRDGDLPADLGPDDPEDESSQAAPAPPTPSIEEQGAPPRSTWEGARDLLEVPARTRVDASGYGEHRHLMAVLLHGAAQDLSPEARQRLMTEIGKGLSPPERRAWANERRLSGWDLGG